MPLNPHSCGDCGLCNCLMARICQGELLVVVVMVCQIRGMCVKVLLVGNYGNAKDNDNNMFWCSYNNTITPPCAIIIMSLQSEVNTHRQQMPPPKTTRQRTIQVPPSSYRRPCSGGRCDGRRKGCGRKFNINTIIIIPHLQSHLLISSHSYSSLSPWSSNTRHAEEGCNLIGFNRYTRGGSLRGTLHRNQRWMDKAADDDDGREGSGEDYHVG